MNSTLINKDQYREEFADCLYHKYMIDTYGITTSCGCEKEDVLSVRNEILNWHLKEDSGALTETSIQHAGWLPVTYRSQPGALIGGLTNDTYGMVTNTCTSASMAYPVNGVNANIIEVNTNGCITRINVNPVINFSTNARFEYTQSTPENIWIIQHDLGYTPNVFTIDSDGQEIEGVVDVVNSNRLKLLFSEPVSGKAFLS